MVKRSLAMAAGLGLWCAGLGLFTLPASPELASEPPEGAHAWPVIEITEDNTRIDRDCIVRIAPGRVIADADGNGVIHLVKGGITLRFEAGSVLRGAEPGRIPDTMAGVGLRIDAAANVKIENARVEGFKVGLWASRCAGIQVLGLQARDLWRQHLKSTPAREDAGDWLWPHENDQQEWRTRYGGAIVLEECGQAVVRDCLVREGQNGIVLDRVSDAKVFDNDCSFLSGWGLAMWRSNKNIIARNALDFCVRGYSHGVYNRGQDSAGLLVFEQCSDNVFAENSATHGGDGFFGFAGKAALGEKGPAQDPRRAGCNDNLIIGNDLSYAAAHGLELTFSFGNQIVANRLVENAICGFWGGYSQDTLLADNDLARNGQKGQREGGAINIEHGFRNRIVANRFSGNSVAIALWDDDDGPLLKTPWAQANHRGSAENAIVDNTLDRDATGLRLRQTTGTVWAGNQLQGVGREIDADAQSVLTERPAGLANTPRRAAPPLPGERRPVGARPALRGREQIVMTPWGPWDHQRPLIRLKEDLGAVHVYELFNLADGTDLNVDSPEGALAQIDEPSDRGPGAAQGPVVMRVVAPGPGVARYTIDATGPGLKDQLTGTLVNCRWTIRVFPFKNDPRTDLEAWRLEARGAASLSTERDTLDLRYGYSGPSGVGLSEEITAAKFGPNRYGTIATTAIPLPRGRWRVVVTSDDGVRVSAVTGGLGNAGAGGPITRTLVERWTVHGPTTDVGVLDVNPPEGQGAEVVQLLVEHFQIDGYAVLNLRIEPEPDAPPPANHPPQAPGQAPPAP
jgi:nitrous oxidase accessory protein NosD